MYPYIKYIKFNILLASLFLWYFVDSSRFKVPLLYLYPYVNIGTEKAIIYRNKRKCTCTCTVKTPEVVK